MKYKLLLFDVYGTLFYPANSDYIYDPGRNGNILKGFDFVIKKYKLHNVSSQKLRSNYLNFIDIYHKRVIEQNGIIKYPEIVIENLWQELLSLFDVKITIDEAIELAREFDNIVNKIIFPVRTIELLQELKKRGYILSLFSNSQLYTIEKLEKYLGKNFFDSRFNILSFQTKFSKPDKLFYDLLIDNINRYNINKTEVLVIGNDKVKDIKFVLDRGIDTILVQKYSSGKVEVNPTYTVENLWEIDKILL